MANTFDLVRLAVGSAELDPNIANQINEQSVFDIYEVELPRPDFSGIPLNWTFVVLDKERFASGSRLARGVLDDARSVISRLPKDKLVVLVSDTPTVHLADEFGQLSRDVFCLDYAELPQSKIARTPPRLAPFILSIQRRVSINPLLARAFSPYMRNTPASGWRFVGRSKQIRQIMDGTENFVLVGARRVGKTSLLYEVVRKMKADDKDVYYVDVQNCLTANSVVNEIVHALDPKEALRAARHGGAFQESVFSNLLRRMSSGSRKTVLILDELGNMLTRLPRDDWGFLGLLRKYGATPGFKFVISCFQEVYFKQQTEFEGPLINFATTMRLDVFSRKEVEEFVVAPLDFWRPLGSAKNDLLNAVTASIGSHPYFLESFCRELFERFTDDSEFDVVREVQTMLKRDLNKWFAAAADEIFFRIPSAAVRYLFLRRCLEAEKAGQSITQGEFSDDWLEKALSQLRYKSTTRGRRNLLDALEMHGLCTALSYDGAKRVVAAPLVYSFVRRSTADFEVWLAKVGSEIEDERKVWELS
jgi:AAA domain